MGKFDIVTDSEIGWLAGVLDADGCISNHKIKDVTYWRLFISNTDISLINKSLLIFEKILGRKLKYYNMKPSKTQYGKRNYKNIEIGKRAELFVLLKILSPHLTVKKGRAKEALEELSIFLKNIDGGKEK